MKKETKKIITGLIISLTTLAAGYAVTMLSFNIFGDLSVNQMRAVFAGDIIALLIAGGATYYYYENKRMKEIRKKEFEERHQQRIEKRLRENEEINRLIFQSNKVA